MEAQGAELGAKPLSRNPVERADHVAAVDTDQEPQLEQQDPVADVDGQSVFVAPALCVSVLVGTEGVRRLEPRQEESAQDPLDNL